MAVIFHMNTRNTFKIGPEISYLTSTSIQKVEKILLNLFDTTDVNDNIQNIVKIYGFLSKKKKNLNQIRKNNLKYI